MHCSLLLSYYDRAQIRVQRMLVADWPQEQTFGVTEIN